ncbi:MAG: hypothetical protein JNK02_07370 [Planctomycetes bacterium]|nr:hypothetical protein [Planctomycetota bacterium]
MHACMDSRARRPLVLLGAALGLAALSACTTGGARPDATGSTTQRDASKAIELRYRAFARKLSIGLVNESHTDRLELYSERQPIDRATTKVSPDEVVDAIVEYFRDQGYFGIAVRGPAPATPPPGATQMLEVVLPDGPYHAIVRPGVTAQFATTFQTCAKALLQVYSDTIQLQAVDEAPGWSEGRRGASGAKPKPGG